MMYSPTKKQRLLIAKQKRPSRRINFTTFPKVVTWLCLSFKTDVTMPVSSLVSFVSVLQRVQESRGTTGLITFCKSVRSNLLNYLSGNPERSSETGVTKEGIPSILGDLIPLVRGRQHKVISVILTILYSTRSLKTKPEPNFEPLVAPFSGDLSNYSMFVSAFWKELGYRPQVKLSKLLRNFNPETYSTKKGPEGHALVEAISEARILPSSLVDSLVTMCGPRMEYLLKKVVRNTTFLDGFLSRVAADPTLGSLLLQGSKGVSRDECKKLWGLSIEEGTLYRRVAHFPDKEHKTRLVGIMDYYSQMALKPLHTYLGNTLKKIRQDCTFDQTNFKKALKGAKIYYSVDLSNATDRFPITLIENLLKAQLPHNYVDAWKDVMVGYPFGHWKTVNQLDYYSYSVGNPMGAYSSFNSFALTHHYLIFYVCKILNKDWKKLPYSILGDDIVIGDKEVGDEYLKIIKTLGLEVSSLKTHTSECMFEFAKRIYLDGVEISPFPYSALKECGKSVMQMTTLLFELSSKNWLSKESLSSSISSYMGIVRDLPSRFRKKTAKKASRCEGVLLTIHGIIPVNAWINSLIKENDYQLPQLSEEVCKNIFQNVVVQVFADSALMEQVEKLGTNVPLFGLSSKLSTLYHEWRRTLSPEILSKVASTDVNDIPIIMAQKAVMKEYKRLIKEIEERDRLGLDWVYRCKTLALPKDDKSLLSNHNFVLSKVSTLFGDLVDEQLQILQLYPQLIPS